MCINDSGKMLEGMLVGVTDGNFLHCCCEYVVMDCCEYEIVGVLQPM
jgi:hypothetical protein